jgi:hypothetical protein
MVICSPVVIGVFCALHCAEVPQLSPLQLHCQVPVRDEGVPCVQRFIGGVSSVSVLSLPQTHTTGGGVLSRST